MGGTGWEGGPGDADDDEGMELFAPLGFSILLRAGKAWVCVKPFGSSGGAQRGCWRWGGHCGIVSPSQEL